MKAVVGAATSPLRLFFCRLTRKTGFDDNGKGFFGFDDTDESCYILLYKRRSVIKNDS